MSKTCFIIMLCIFLLLKLETTDAQEKKKSFVLVVHPRATTTAFLDAHDLIHFQIKYYDVRYPKYLYDYLHRFNEFVFKTEFDELMILFDKIQYQNKEDAINKISELISYTPDAYLFLSMDETIDKVEFRAEMVDLSAKSLAVASQKINFQNFLITDSVQSAIQHIGDLLHLQINPQIETVPPPPPWGFISLEEYGNTSDNLTYGIGLGLGSLAGSTLTLEDISSELRRIPPHPDDVRNRPDILPVNIPDNYLVRENSAGLNLGQRSSLDIVQISLWGIVNLSLRTTRIKEPDQTLNQNIFRKWYVTNNVNDPDNPNSGTAYIYYGMKSIDRKFFESKSFSLPLFVTYPVCYAGRNKEVIFKLLGGTNILLPDKIELESEKGWYRFGEYEIQNKSIVGDLKEIEWYAGIDIEGNLSKTLKLGIQCMLVYNDYQGNFDDPISLKSEGSPHSSVRLYLMNMLPW